MGIHDNVAIVGSYRDDDGGENSGSINIYVRNGVNWKHHAKLLAPKIGLEFGISVGVYEGTFVSSSGSGEVYAFS